jgi:hypothetical protein
MKNFIELLRLNIAVRFHFFIFGKKNIFGMWPYDEAKLAHALGIAKFC